MTMVGVLLAFGTWGFVTLDGQRGVDAFYCACVTLTTVGYGDIYGMTSQEYIFTMSIEFLGIFVFAYMMGNINNLIT